MCFCNYSYYEDITKRLKARTTPIKAYKRLSSFTTGENLYSPFYPSNKPWKIGIRKSNRRSANLSKAERTNYYVSRGIHCYRNKSNALDCVGSSVGDVVIVVYINPKDVVAVNREEILAKDVIVKSLKGL